MSSYPMYSHKPLLATVSQPPTQRSYHGKTAVRIEFSFDHSSRKDCCFITNPSQIEAMCSWAQVRSLRDLVDKKFGIKIHEELGFITDIFKEDLSDSFCIYD